jgi:hypothetical protein
MRYGCDCTYLSEKSVARRLNWPSTRGSRCRCRYVVNVTVTSETRPHKRARLASHIPLKGTNASGKYRLSTGITLLMLWSL